MEIAKSARRISPHEANIHVGLAGLAHRDAAIIQFTSRSSLPLYVYRASYSMTCMQPRFDRVGGFQAVGGSKQKKSQRAVSEYRKIYLDLHFPLVTTSALEFC